MPSNTVISGPLLVQGLRSDFADTYRITYEGVKAILGEVMELGVPQGARTQSFGYFEAAPYPRRWPMGETISNENFESRSFSITAYDWGRRVSWHVNDRQDDRTGTLYEQARMCGTHWATLPERLLFQVLQGITDNELLPAVPNAPDGAALYSATDGAGANRFGVSGGNLVSGGGVASAATIRTNFFTAISRFPRFLDTKQQPLWDAGAIAKGYILFYNPTNWQVMSEAFVQGRTVQVIQNVAGAENVAAAAVTNVIMDAGISVTLIPTPRITDNDMYIFLRGTHRKAIIETVLLPLYEVFATEEVSDHSRNTLEEYVQWRSRGSIGVNVPYQTIKIDNA